MDDVTDTTPPGDEKAVWREVQREYNVSLHAALLQMSRADPWSLQDMI